MKCSWPTPVPVENVNWAFYKAELEKIGRDAIKIHGSALKKLGES